ncbi:hypothetical protein [Kitasatospora sp. NPDC085464]|uniref:hypothetical protein n=1 Tax=Kitasatospora sp. NPDC085464 TaxID=3364063 RepID=UPI0037CC4D9E
MNVSAQIVYVAPQIGIPVCEERLDICLHDAEYWAEHLGNYSAKLQAKADFFQVSAVALSAVTSGAAWTLISSNRATWAVVLVAVVSLLTALAAAYPRARNYSRGAVDAARLNADYGRLYGRLMDARHAVETGRSPSDDHLQSLVEEFQAVRSKRQMLHPRPARLEHELEQQLQVRTVDVEVDVPMRPPVSTDGSRWLRFRSNLHAYLDPFAPS